MARARRGRRADCRFRRVSGRVKVVGAVDGGGSPASQLVGGGMGMRMGRGHVLDVLDVLDGRECEV
jgi:hypothetical protein